MGQDFWLGAGRGGWGRAGLAAQAAVGSEHVGFLEGVPVALLRAARTLQCDAEGKMRLLHVEIPFAESHKEEEPILFLCLSL